MGADRCDNLRVCRGQRKGRKARLDTVQKQRDGWNPRECGKRMQSACWRGQRKRFQWEDMLTANPQWSATGNEDFQACAQGKQLCDLRRGSQDMLKIIQGERQRIRRPHMRQRLGEWLSMLR